MLVTGELVDHVVHREVDALALGIRLWVICRGHQVGDTQPLVQTLHHFSGELAAPASQDG